MKKLEWVTNVSKDINITMVHLITGQSVDSVAIRTQALYDRNVEGPPKATASHSVDALVKMNMIGLYRKE